MKNIKKVKEQLITSTGEIAYIMQDEQVKISIFPLYNCPQTYSEAIEIDNMLTPKHWWDFSSYISQKNYICNVFSEVDSYLLTK